MLVACIGMRPKQEELQDLLSRAFPVHLSGGADQVQDSHSGVAKFSLPTAPYRRVVFLWGMI